MSNNLKNFHITSFEWYLPQIIKNLYFMFQDLEILFYPDILKIAKFRLLYNGD